MNPGFLITAAAALVLLVTTAAGGHIYRSEIITWSAVTMLVSVVGFVYSCWYAREKKERDDAWNRMLEAEHRAMVAEWKAGRAERGTAVNCLPGSAAQSCSDPARCPVHSDDFLPDRHADLDPNADEADDV